MFLFLFFLIQKIRGELLTNLFATSPTLDGQGTIFNNATGLCNPLKYYQSIFQNDITGEITIESFADRNCRTRPTIVFDKKPRIVSFIKEIYLNISINHSLVSGEIQNNLINPNTTNQIENATNRFSFLIMLNISKSNGTIISIVIYLTSDSSIDSTSYPSVDGQFRINLFQAPNRISFLPLNSRRSFSKNLNLAQFYIWLSDNSKIENDDILSEIQFAGAFNQQQWQTSLNYSFGDNNNYQYKERIITNMHGGMEFYFSPTQYSQGDLQYLSYSKTLPITKIGMYFVLNPNNINKIRPCNGERIGYYKGGYHIHPQSALDFDYFPLDPGLKISYTILSNDNGDYDPITNPYIFSRCFRVSLRRDYSLQTNSFTNLADQTLVSEQIYICNKITQLLHAQDNLFEVFSYQNSNVIFQAYRRENKTVNQPRIYHFLGNFTGDKIQLDLFFFVSRLYQSGSFKENERISEISKCTRFHSGTGSYFFNPTVFPTKSELSFLKNCSIPGCIECDTALCVTCNPTENWSLINGLCISSSKNSNLYLQQKSLSCLLSNDTGESCLTAPLPLKAQVALTLTSTPNIGMVLKLSQLVNLVDDFTFYIYINMTYGEQFHKFLYLMWNISIQRWVPYSFSSFYYNIQDQYDQKTTIKRKISLPQLWNNLNEDPSFIRNTRDYWIGSIPFNFAVFLFLHILFLILRKFESKLSKYLLKFKWFTILAVNLFLHNLQLLAFRSFQQIFYVQTPPQQDLNIKIIYFSNQVVCHITFFCVIISACAGQFLTQIFIGKNIKHALEIVYCSGSTIWFMVLLQSIKVISGFMHASYYIENITKLSFLLGTQIVIFMGIILLREHFRRKAMFLLMIYEYLLKIFIHVCLLFRAILEFNNYKLKRIEDQIIGQIEITVVWIVIGVTTCELLTAFIKESRLKVSFSKINKVGSASSTRNKSLRKQHGEVKTTIQEYKLEEKIDAIQFSEHNVTTSKNCKSFTVKKNNNFINQPNRLMNKHLQQTGHFSKVIFNLDKNIYQKKNPVANSTKLKK